MGHSPTHRHTWQLPTCTSLGSLPLGRYSAPETLRHTTVSNAVAGGASGSGYLCSRLRAGRGMREVASTCMCAWDHALCSGTGVHSSCPSKRIWPWQHRGAWSEVHDAWRKQHKQACWAARTKCPGCHVRVTASFGTRLLGTSNRIRRHKIV